MYIDTTALLTVFVQRQLIFFTPVILNKIKMGRMKIKAKATRTFLTSQVHTTQL